MSLKNLINNKYGISNNEDTYKYTLKPEQVLHVRGSNSPYKVGALVQLNEFKDEELHTDGSFNFGELYEILDIDWSDCTILLEDAWGEECWESMEMFDVID